MRLQSAETQVRLGSAREDASVSVQHKEMVTAFIEQISVLSPTMRVLAQVWVNGNEVELKTRCISSSV